MTDDICDVGSLESALGPRPLGVMMKSIPALDPHCAAILERSVAAVLVHRDPTGAMRADVVGGATGFAHPDSPTLLTFAGAVPAGDDPPAALLVLTPGWRETLRVNGRLVDGGLEVEEAFVHCGKAMIRSGFWATGPTTEGGPTGTADHVLDVHRDFLAATPFAVIGSCDTDGGADASPKGDPAGFVRVLDDRTVAVPDRPGNHRTDTFHNVVDRPALSVMAMVPGDDRVLEIRGRARVTTDADLLEPMAVKGKVPRAALVVDVDHSDLRVSAAVRAADLWDPALHVGADDLPRATRMWTDHVKSNDTEGLAARAVRAGASETALRAGVSIDYRTNLY